MQYRWNIESQIDTEKQIGSDSKKDNRTERGKVSGLTNHEPSRSTVLEKRNGARRRNNGKRRSDYGLTKKRNGMRRKDSFAIISKIWRKRLVHWHKTTKELYNSFQYTRERKESTESNRFPRKLWTKSRNGKNRSIINDRLDWNFSMRMSSWRKGTQISKDNGNSWKSYWRISRNKSISFEKKRLKYIDKAHRKAYKGRQQARRIKNYQ